MNWRRASIRRRVMRRTRLARWLGAISAASFRATTDVTSRLWLPRLARRLAVSLLVACALYPAKPDRAVFSVMRGAAPDVNHVEVIRRVTVDAELDLVVVLGTVTDRPAGSVESGWWGDKTTLGILLQRRDRPESIYKIALRKGYGDCLARVESATASDVVLSCTSEKGESGPNRKFIY